MTAGRRRIVKSYPRKGRPSCIVLAILFRITKWYFIPYKLYAEGP